MLNLKNNKFKNKMRLLRTGLSSLCLCGAIASTIAQFGISNQTDKKLKDDNYTIEPGLVNSIVDSKKILEYNDEKIKFHEVINDPFSENFDEIIKTFNGVPADIPVEYMPYVKLFFFGSEQKWGNMDFNITNEMLDSITTFDYLDIDVNTNLEYLSLFKNLKKIRISFDSLDIINNLPYNTNIEEIEISNHNNNKKLIIDKNNINKIMQAFPNVKKIDFYHNIIFEPGSLESLSNYNIEIINLSLNESDFNFDIDFSKLSFLKKLKFNYARAYDLAISFNSFEYNSLVSNGTEVEFGNDNTKKQYLDICKKIDDIISKIGFNDNMTLHEKIDKTIIYILENYKYDEDVKTLLRNDPNAEIDDDKFSKNGFLYGCLESDTQICINYAAMMEAILDRVSNPDDSYLLTSYSHAWNLIKENNKIYYYDLTWMDQLDDESRYSIVDSHIYSNHDLIVDGYGEKAPQYIKWYKKSIDLKDESESSKKDHTPDYVPKYMDIENYYNFDTFNNDYIEIPNELIEKYNHILSRTDALKLYEESKEKQNMYTIISIALIISAIILNPNNLISKKEKNKTKVKTK